MLHNIISVHIVCNVTETSITMQPRPIDMHPDKKLVKTYITYVLITLLDIISVLLILQTNTSKDLRKFNFIQK